MRADRSGPHLQPAAVRLPGVRCAPAGAHPDLRGPGGGTEPQGHPRHLQPESAGEGGLPSGDVEHHTAAADGETHLRRELGQNELKRM